MKFGISREVLPPLSSAYRAAAPYALVAGGLAVAVFAAFELGAHLRPVHVDITRFETVEPAVVALPPDPSVVPIPSPMLIHVTTPAPVPVLEPQPQEHIAPPANPTSADGFHFVFDVDGTPHMQLAAESTGAKHGPVRVAGEYGTTAIATVSPDDVPAGYQQWLGREVIVDGSCRARVEGFAVVARLIGDAGYYGEADEWNATTLFEAGAVSLAARLSACSGTYARDAQLAGILAPTPVENAKAVAAAREDLFASALAKKAEQEWDATTTETRLTDALQVSVQTVRHPTTGREWVSIHAMINEGCGGPDINLLGLYKVNDDSSVTRVRLDQLSNTSAIKMLLDVDGDGQLERIATDWLGMSMRLETMDGAELAGLEKRFYGCPC